MNSDFKLFIPARISSKRLPRKPLIDIFGIPLIVRTFNKAASVVDAKNIYVVTDSEEIKEVTEDNNIQTILTSDKCLTGTDRVAEAATFFDTNNIYNLQGDEPFFPKDDLKKFIEETIDHNKNYIGVTPISDPEKIQSLSIPKVVLSGKRKILYTSRSPIPASKEVTFNPTFRQVCIYKYNKVDLLNYYGPKLKKSRLENIEDLEILRFIENDIDVNTILLSDLSFSIDTKEDLENLERFFN